MTTITIKIEDLNVTQLEALREITYNNGDMNTTKIINDRIAFLNGWTEVWNY